MGLGHLGRQADRRRGPRGAGAALVAVTGVEMCQGAGGAGGCGQVWGSVGVLGAHLMSKQEALFGDTSACGHVLTAVCSRLPCPWGVPCEAAK